VAEGVCGSTKKFQVGANVDWLNFNKVTAATATGGGW
jgi:hypothetical protein